jgi:hypothetical protein
MQTDIEAVSIEEFLKDLREKLHFNIWSMEPEEKEDVLEDLYELQLAYDSSVGTRILIKQCIQIIKSVK